MTHICISNLTIIGADNDLSPGRHQAIIWTNAGILSFQTIGKNSSKTHTFSFKKMHLKMSSVILQQFCLCPNVSRGELDTGNIDQGIMKKSTRKWLKNARKRLLISVIINFRGMLKNIFKIYLNKTQPCVYFMCHTVHNASSFIVVIPVSLSAWTGIIGEWYWQKHRKKGSWFSRNPSMMSIEKIISCYVLFCYVLLCYVLL